MAAAPGAPEHTDQIVEGELASYCTMSNVQSYTLSSREAKKPVYAMVAVANASGDSRGITYGVDKVRILEKEHLPIVKGTMENLYRLFLAAGPARAAQKSEALGLFTNGCGAILTIDCMVLQCTFGAAWCCRAQSNLQPGCARA